jgi:hypothetical protein
MNRSVKEPPMSTAVAVPAAAPSAASPHGGPRVRWTALWRRASLDRELADGADLGARPELAFRAEQLRSPRVRAGYAAVLRSVLDAAAEPAVPLSAAAPLNRREIRAARPTLLALTTALGRPEPVRPRGVAMAVTLLRETDSPLFAPCEPGALLEAAREASHALD